MIDPTKRCKHCVFYSDFDSQCQAHPPAYAGRIKDEYGDTVTDYSQPIIELEWAETCGEWQDGHPAKTPDERMAEIARAAGLDRQAREAKTL